MTAIPRSFQEQEEAKLIEARNAICEALKKQLPKNDTVIKAQEILNKVKEKSAAFNPSELDSLTLTKSARGYILSVEYNLKSSRALKQVFNKLNDPQEFGSTFGALTIVKNPGAFKSERPHIEKRESNPLNMIDPGTYVFEYSAPTVADIVTALNEKVLSDGNKIDAAALLGMQR